MTKLLQGVSLRARVSAGFILIVILSTSLVAFVGSRILTRALLDEEIRQMRLNLRSASMVYAHNRDTLRQSVQGAARSERLALALEPEGKDALPDLLALIREEQRLHFLTFVDTRNPRMLRALGQDSGPSGANRFPILGYLQRALAGETAAGTEVLLRESLLREGQALAQRARIPVHSPREHENAPPEVDSGLTLIAASPVETRSGFKGVLYGGILLNRDTRLVTRIGDFVFGARHAEDAGDGIVTLYLGDVSVATNAAAPDGEKPHAPPRHRAPSARGRPRPGRFGRRQFACQLAQPPERRGGNAVRRDFGSCCSSQASMIATFPMVAGSKLVVLDSPSSSPHRGAPTAGRGQIPPGRPSIGRANATRPGDTARPGAIA